MRQTSAHIKADTNIFSSYDLGRGRGVGGGRGKRTDRMKYRQTERQTETGRQLLMLYHRDAGEG